jgi:tetratricopeptide (TPR) repeat protein
MALGAWHAGRGEYAQAEEHYLAAEAAFPGFAEESLAAELALAGVLIAHDQEDEAMRAAERYLRYEAGNYPWRMRVARWHLAAGRFDEAAFLFHEANEIDPFARELHLLWARSLEGAGRHEEALREWRVAAIVPVELDLGATSEASADERAAWLAGEVRALVALGRLQEARESLERARELAPGLEELEELEELEAAEAALEAAGG